MVKNLAARKAVEKTRDGKLQNRLSHRAWKSRQHPRDSHFPTASAAAVYKTNSCRTDGDISVEVNWGTFLSSYDILSKFALTAPTFERKIFGAQPDPFLFPLCHFGL